MVSNDNGEQTPTPQDASVDGLPSADAPSEGSLSDAGTADALDGTTSVSDDAVAAIDASSDATSDTPLDSAPETSIDAGPPIGWILQAGTGPVFGLALDSSLNIFAGGNSAFNNGAPTYDTYVQKLDGLGNTIWQRTFSGDVLGHAIAADSAGNAILAGRTWGPVDFGGGALPPGAFVTKLNADGSLHVARSYPASAGNDVEIESVTTGAAADVFAVGTLTGTMDFGGGPLAAPAGSRTGLTLHVDADRNYVSASLLQMSATGESEINLVRADGADLVLAGTFSNGTLTVGGATLSPQAGPFFVVKLDATGAYKASAQFQSGYLTMRGMAGDSTGAVYVVGGFHGLTDFGGGPVTTTGNDDIFVVKLDASLHYAWSRTYGDNGINAQAAYGVAMDPAGNVLVTGEFNGTVDFGGATYKAFGDLDTPFVVKLDANGSYLSSKVPGEGTDVSPFTALGYAVVAPTTSSAVLGGEFTNSMTFGYGEVSQGNQDGFVARFPL